MRPNMQLQRLSFPHFNGSVDDSSFGEASPPRQSGN